MGGVGRQRDSDASGSRDRDTSARGDDDLSGVSRTAFGVARVRAQESLRPDRLFTDPYAEMFLAAFPAAFPEVLVPVGRLRRLRAVLNFHTVVRTRFYDDYLLAAAAAGCAQVVLLAAGLDTRAYRLTWPAGVRLFELDLPDVVALKDTVLTDRGAQPRCARTVLPVDLHTDWPTPLLAAGFDPAVPTAWLAEGLLVYLTAEQVTDLLTKVGDLSAPGSQLATERGDSTPALAGDTAPADRVSSLWRGGLGAGTGDWLTAHGWHVVRHDLVAVGAGYGRTAPEPVDRGFLTARR